MRASPKLLGLAHASAKQVGTAAVGARSRYTEGETPTMALNVRLKVPRLVKPTSKQTSVTR